MSSENSQDTDRLEELLADWELSRLAGKEIPPEELAKDHPELLDAVRESLSVLKSMSWVMEDPDEGLGSGEADRGATSLPESSLSTSELIAAIEASGLLSSRELAGLTEQSGIDSATARELAERLVRHGAITAYQAQTLLSERDTPLLLDRYIILDVIGAGGMGLVFKALHRSMERVVALKILPKAAVDSPAKVERFRREIKAVAKLSHPNIAAALDAHEAEGTHFLVMEYVQGKNLFEIVNERGPFSAQQAASIVAKVADALGEAHSQGVIHRDVKPSNVLLSDVGIPKLLDLGIARVQHATGEPEALTTDGIPLGTVAYIAPEQIQGGQDIDCRADVYGLGCTLFFLLTGKPVFDKTSGVHVVAAHLTEEPPSLRNSGANVPAALERVFERMVAKDPKDRFDSMTQVVAALDATGLANASAETTARPVTASARRPRGPVSGWRLAATAIAALAVLLTMFLLMREPVAPAVDRSAGGAANESKEATGSPAGTKVSVGSRDMARWILTHGGHLVVENGVGEWECEEPVDLPSGSFDIVAVELEDTSGEIELEALGSQTKLSRLALWGVALDTADLSVISSLESIVDLELSDCGLTDESMASIAAMTWLQAINLTDNALSDDGITKLVGLPSLTSVNLRETGLTEVGLKSLQKLPMLVELDVSETDISQQGFEEIIGIESLQRLKAEGLDLTASEIAALSRLPALVELSLGQSEVTDEVVEAIAQLSQLELIEFVDADLRDRHLPVLAKLQRLELIEASETRLTRSGVERFERLRPDVEVSWSDDDEED